MKQIFAARVNPFSDQQKLSIRSLREVRRMNGCID